MSKNMQKKNKLIKFLGLSMVALLLGSYVSISAIDNPYQAGETLDPDCAPGEVNCTVEIGSSQWTTSGDNIYFTGGNVGVGITNPTKGLTVNGGVLARLGDEVVSDFGFTEKDSLSVGMDPVDISISDNYAYVLSQNMTNDIIVFNISDKDNITQEDTFNLGNFVTYDIEVVGSYAYVLSVSPTVSLRVLNISDIYNISIVDTILINDTTVFSGYISKMSIEGNRLYVPDMNDIDSEILVFDISDPENITNIGYFESSSDPDIYELAVDTNGNYSYVIATDGLGGYFLQTVNISDLVNEVYLDQISSNLSYPISLKFHDGYVYVLNEDNNVSVFNVTDPNNITFVDSITTDGELRPNAMDLVGNYLIFGDVTDTGDSLHLYDISDPENITLVDMLSSLNTYSINSVFYDNGYVYFTDVQTSSINIAQMGQNTNVDNSINSIGGVAIGRYAAMGSFSPDGGLIVSGQVGIGTDNPIAKLDIVLNNDITYVQQFVEFDGNDDSLDDATFSGVYTGIGPNDIYVYIDSEGTPDTFSYDDNNGDCVPATNVPITGEIQEICLGISIKFNSTTGHSVDDQWNYYINEDTSTLKPLSIRDSNDNVYFDLDIYNNKFLIGDSAGFEATNAYNSNFIGEASGYSATNAEYSNFIGPSAGWLASEASYSNFIGYQAGYWSTNSSNSNFIGTAAGYGEDQTVSDSNFIGTYAGAYSNVQYSNFIGYYAGNNAGGSNNSNFIGNGSGNNTINSEYSNFIGYNAGGNADGSVNSNFIGYQAGLNVNASFSNFIGINAGYQATNATYSNFIGPSAGSGATNAGISVFIGSNTGDGAINAQNSIFLGRHAGQNDTVNNTSNINDFSILIGPSTNTGGYSNSIAIGGSAVNTASNQFMIGSTARPINTTRFQGATTECTITTGTGIACTSDERLKTVTSPLNINKDTGEEISILDKLTKVKTVNFIWNDSEDYKNNIGFLAQDLYQYFPELVNGDPTDEDNYLSVYYSNMTPILVEAVRELNLKLENISTDEENSFREALSSWFVSATNNIKEFIADTIRARNMICIGEGEDEVCVTKEELLQIKINSGLVDEKNIDESSVLNDTEENMGNNTGEGAGDETEVGGVSDNNGTNTDTDVASDESEPAIVEDYSSDQDQTEVSDEDQSGDEPADPQVEESEGTQESAI